MAHDVVVIGATIAGLTAAGKLAAEGFDVLVLDPGPARVSAAIGHGVAAVAHASTVANMRAAYGDQAVKEHVRRNLAGMDEIKRVAAAGGVAIESRDLHDHSLGFALERELGDLSELLQAAGAECNLLTTAERRRASAGIRSSAMLLDPEEYADALLGQAKVAGARVLQDSTVIKLARGDGTSAVAFRNNLDWQQPPQVVHAAAVVDTLGVSPWGKQARAAEAELVPTLVCDPIEPEPVISLVAGPPVWMIRPLGKRVLLLGPKCNTSNVGAMAENLATWATNHLAAENLQPGMLTIDPSDRGRPIAGASAIPGGYYTRGNGRGELMNGTASGCWLAAVLVGDDPTGKRAALPRLARARAQIRGLFRRP